MGALVDGSRSPKVVGSSSDSWRVVSAFSLLLSAGDDDSSSRDPLMAGFSISSSSSESLELLEWSLEISITSGACDFASTWGVGMFPCPRALEMTDFESSMRWESGFLCELVVDSAFSIRGAPLVRRADLRP